MRRLIASALLVAACSADQEPDPNPWTVAENNGTNNGSDGTNNGANNGDNNGACNEPSFDCSEGCGGDYFMQSECVDDRMRCEPGWTPVDDCPPGSCFGLPLPGEVCDDGFKCRPDDSTLEQCPDLLCATCSEFDPALHRTDTCICRCNDDGNVVCGPPPPEDCPFDAKSSLPGVEIRFLADRCSWTRDELAAGVKIGYEIVVDAAQAPATTMPGSPNGCQQPDASGLIAGFQITSDAGDRYCLCDVGLCMAFDEIVALTPGVHPAEVSWTGNNWDGPSDTGNPMGTPFVATTALIAVKATGRDPNGDTYEVSAEMPLTLLD